MQIVKERRKQGRKEGKKKEREGGTGREGWREGGKKKRLDYMCPRDSIVLTSSIPSYLSNILG